MAQQGFNINVKSDIKQVTRYLSRVQKKQIPFAAARALQIVGKAAQQEVKKEISRVIDRPTPFTRNATQVWGYRPGIKITSLSTLKRNPTVTVMLRDEASGGTAPAKYLEPLLTGGPRRHKRFERALIRAGVMRQNEYAVPGDDIRLNKFGNLTKGTITSMLSQVRANPDPYQNATNSTRSKRSRRARAYFVMRGFRGVMVRTSRKAFTVFLAFVKRPSYRKRLKFQETVRGVAQFRFKREFESQLAKALRTAR